MNLPALAFTALTFVNLERNEFAGEIIDVIEQKLKTVANKPLASLDGVHNAAWACDEVETTARDRAAPQLNYRMNLDSQNKAIQGGNWNSYDQFRCDPSKGVQIQKVK